MYLIDCVHTYIRRSADPSIRPMGGPYSHDSCLPLLPAGSFQEIKCHCCQLQVTIEGSPFVTPHALHAGPRSAPSVTLATIAVFDFCRNPPCDYVRSTPNRRTYRPLALVSACTEKCGDGCRCRRCHDCRYRCTAQRRRSRSGSGGSLGACSARPAAASFHAHSRRGTRQIQEGSRRATTCAR